MVTFSFDSPPWVWESRWTSRVWQRLWYPPSGLLFLTDTTQCRSGLYASMGRRTPNVSGWLCCQPSLIFLIWSVSLHTSISLKTRVQVFQTVQAVGDTRLGTLVSPKLKRASQILFSLLHKHLSNSQLSLDYFKVFTLMWAFWSEKPLCAVWFVVNRSIMFQAVSLNNF